MITVNSAIAIAKTMIPTFTLPCGITFPTSPAITSPTPAAVKIAPREASSIGSIDRGPTCESSLSESVRNTAGLLSGLNTISRMMEMMIPAPIPTIAPSCGRKIAKPTAQIPIDRAGRKIFIPILSNTLLEYSSVGFAVLPTLTL